MWQLVVASLIVTPVGGCLTGSVRDTERSLWPPAYDSHPYYIVGWKEHFVLEERGPNAK